MNNILVLDTETTGLIKTKPSYSVPYTLQYSSIIVDLDSLQVLRINNIRIKPYYDVNSPEIDWKMVSRVSGNTIPILESDGVELEHAQNVIISDLLSANLIVGHNISYDLQVLLFGLLDGTDVSKALKSHLFGSNHRLSNSSIIYDTMLQGIDICKIPHKTGNGYKYPKLSELYRRLYNEDFENQHDSLYDVVACLKCFLRMKHVEYSNVMEQINDYLR